MTLLVSFTILSPSPAKTISKIITKTEGTDTENMFL